MLLLETLRQHMGVGNNVESGCRKTHRICVVALVRCIFSSSLPKNCVYGSRLNLFIINTSSWVFAQSLFRICIKVLLLKISISNFFCLDDLQTEKLVN